MVYTCKHTLYQLSNSLQFPHEQPDKQQTLLYRVQVRWVCWLIKLSNTMVIEPAFGTFGSVGRCQRFDFLKCYKKKITFLPYSNILRCTCI